MQWEGTLGLLLYKGLPERFVTASQLFCVGAMAIVGSLQSGLTGNHELQFKKSM